MSARALAEFVRRHGDLFVLTGAGCSTASGIPEYRDDDGEWKHAAPVQFRDFVGDPAVRQRYWGRAVIGWERIVRARPSPAHESLAALERLGYSRLLVTQNVDRLHQAAGANRVVDLHGRVDRVSCLDCGAHFDRRVVQEELRALNPDWAWLGAAAPDGDALIEGVDFTCFRIAPCRRCGGVLKPDVVFFGENVPAHRVATAFDALDQASALLVVGSSLMVYSGYRFVRAAAEAGKPVALLNRGLTRADDMASLRLHEDANRLLPAVIAELSADIAERA